MKNILPMRKPQASSVPTTARRTRAGAGLLTVSQDLGLKRCRRLSALALGRRDFAERRRLPPPADEGAHWGEPPQARRLPPLYANCMRYKLQNPPGATNGVTWFLNGDTRSYTSARVHPILPTAKKYEWRIL